MGTRSAQQLKDLGVPSSYYEHARYFARLWGNLGWTAKQIDEGIKFGVSYNGNGSEEDVSDKFRWLAAHIGAPDPERALDAGLGLRDNIALNGLDALPEIPRAESSFTKADEARMAEIRAISRNDPQAYDSDRALQSEALALIEASLPAPGGDTQ